jgi:lipoate-protein ligase B
MVVDAASGAARLPQADYVGYVRRLEEALILALARLGVPAHQVKGLTGVWVDRRLSGEDDRSPLSALHSPSYAKIAAIGVKVDARGVTRHGFALNSYPDMSYWQGIIACGLVDHAVTCLAEQLDPVPPMECIIGEVAHAFAQIFDYELKFV